MALTLGVFALAALALGSGADRISATHPGLERLVPGPFRAQADRSAATTAIALGRFAEARSDAMAALAADPFDRLPAAQLGTARLAMNDEAGAEAAFRLAAKLGWRERLTQVYWYETAQRSGDWPRASMRLDAVLRADPLFPQAEQLLAPLEAEPAGQEALAARLAQRPGWLASYLQPDPELEPAAMRNRAVILSLLPGQGLVMGCDKPRALAEALLAHGLRGEASQLWQAHCPDERVSDGLTDGQFDRLDTIRAGSPFGWHKRSYGDVSISTTPGPDGGKVLEAENGSSISRLLVFQAVGLAPGRYRLMARVSRDGQPVSGRVLASLDCAAQPGQPQLGQGDPATTGQFLSIGPCDTQLLGLWLTAGPGRIVIDDIRISPAR